MKIQEMKKLIDELNKASELYYNSEDVIMSDIEYDKKLDILKSLEEETGVVFSNSPIHKVGSKVLTELPEIKHNHPMLSLNKCHSTEEIINFANGINELIAMTKADGLTVSLCYKDGKLISAETRGDGKVGSDCTEHIQHFLNVPMNICKDGTYIIDGEAVILQDDFELINKDGKFKNPRNTASGSLSVLDTKIVKDRRLSFLAWDVIVGGKSNMLSLNLCEAKELGFTIVPTKCVITNCSDINAENDSILTLSKSRGIPCDGVVWKFNDIEYGKSLGKTEHHFNNGIAWKPEKVESETELLDIDWTLGKTGILTPTAVFKPVELDGTTVERASLHNVSILKELLGEHPYKGQMIKVYKANMIIPQVSWCDKDNQPSDESQYLFIPLTCPVCNCQVQVKSENDTEVLICTNAYCSGKLLGRFNHFVSKGCMNIDGLSEATLSYLIREKAIINFVDIYKIHKNISFVNKWKNTKGYGKKSVDKILAAIEKSRTTTMAQVLDAISIPLVGTKASKDISNFCNGDIDYFLNLVVEDINAFKKIDGFGEKMLFELDKWIHGYGPGDLMDLLGELKIQIPK